jgi:hypothetical protein
MRFREQLAQAWVLGKNPIDVVKLQPIVGHCRRRLSTPSWEVKSLFPAQVQVDNSPSSGLCWDYGTGAMDPARPTHFFTGTEFAYRGYTSGFEDYSWQF